MNVMSFVYGDIAQSKSRSEDRGGEEEGIYLWGMGVVMGWDGTIEPYSRDCGES